MTMNPLLKKVQLALLAAASLLAALACGTEPVAVTTASPQYVEERTEAYPENEPIATHRAEHGYTLKAMQGYNRWYYQTLTSSGYADMKHRGQWTGHGAAINGPLLVPADDASAARTFVAPASGETVIYGTVRSDAASTSDASVKICVNDRQIWPAEGSVTVRKDDASGWFQRLEVTLAAGDEVHFIASGAGAVVDWRPVVDYLPTEDEPLHYGLTDYVGDVHPYYHDGTLYLYYLALDGNFTSTLAVSDNLVAFRDQPLTVSALNAPGSFYFALGIIKEGNYFRSFYGEGKNVGSSRSLDLIHWESGIVWDEETYEKQYSPSSNYPAGTRDPYAFFDPDTNNYHIVATGYRANENYVWSNTTGYDAYIVLYTSVGPSLSDWEKNPVTGRVGYHRPLLQFGDWVNGDGGDPEVSQMMKIGDRWYIFASIAGRGGDHWVGRPSYWTGSAGTPILEMDWQSAIAEERFLDGEDLCAAQIFDIGDRHYIFGWITQKNTSGGWGGTLNLLREVYQLEDGSLGTRLESEFRRLIDGGKLFEADRLDDVSTTGTWTEAESGFVTPSGVDSFGYEDLATLVAPGTYGRTIVTLELSLSEFTKAGGISVGTSEGTVEMGLRDQAGFWQLYLKNRGADGKVSATQNVLIADPDRIELTIILEDDVAELFLDGRYALSARSQAILSENVTIAAFAAGAGTGILSFDIRRLVAAQDFGH